MRPIIIMGGGLWGSLLAYRLKTLRPDIPFKLFEKGPKLGGNHTWSFHETDFNQEWIKPLISKSWNGYSVSFPEYDRDFNSSYHSIVSDHFHNVIYPKIETETKLNSAISLEEAKANGDFVFDCRGQADFPQAGFQKFVGLEVVLKNNHFLKYPVLMDATVEQIDGYRFLYYLPFSGNRILIEDTRYSENSNLDKSSITGDLLSEIKKKGWVIDEIKREECGVLPIPIEAPSNTTSENVINLSGMFHDTTGYSLPDAVRVIDLLLKTSEINFLHSSRVIRDFQASRESNRKFFRMLNRMMFKAVGTENRYQMLQFFYKHPENLIQKFYAGDLSLLDKIRFFMGKPPVEIESALRTFVKTENLSLGGKS